MGNEGYAVITSGRHDEHLALSNRLPCVVQRNN